MADGLKDNKKFQAMLDKRGWTIDYDLLKYAGRDMDLIIDPPRGVEPVRIGMTLDEVLEALRPFGELRKRGPLPFFPAVTVSVNINGLDFQALLEDGRQVTAIELWRPGIGRGGTVRVLVDGEDVFATPADELLEHARNRGWGLDESDPEHPKIPGVTLRFTRTTTQEEYPRRADGVPVYFTAVLVADEKY
ncbi:hypothetical protein SRB5_16100 [Streptomyces sp. RB5]|uniref:Uncharacterized protein n=1 Tax=Streptomyces smaragdinus TaxID=2585196 RepID=A0A7K0CDE7_9ACTN|nr:hypothetical protein [Streptomyces smaragdinus]MQY11491.1 hypothetical protein [Streptomyces smaragdinus]